MKAQRGGRHDADENDEEEEEDEEEEDEEEEEVEELAGRDVTPDAELTRGDSMENRRFLSLSQQVPPFATPSKLFGTPSLSRSVGDMSDTVFRTPSSQEVLLLGTPDAICLAFSDPRAQIRRVCRAQRKSCRAATRSRWSTLGLARRPRAPSLHHQRTVISLRTTGSSRARPRRPRSSRRPAYTVMYVT